MNKDHLLSIKIKSFEDTLAKIKLEKGNYLLGRFGDYYEIYQHSREKGNTHNLEESLEFIQKKGHLNAQEIAILNINVSAEFRHEIEYRVNSLLQAISRNTP